MQKQILSVLLAAGAVSAASSRQPASAVQRRQSEEAFQQIVDDCLKAFEPESPTYVKDINDCVADALGIQRRQILEEDPSDKCYEQHPDGKFKPVDLFNLDPPKMANRGIHIYLRPDPCTPMHFRCFVSAA